MKKLFSLFAVALLAVMSLNLNTLTVTAAEPTTYIVNYDGDECRYQVGSTWNDDDHGRELYYLYQVFKDGDYLVCADAGTTYTVDASTLNIGNLTFAPSARAIVTAKSIDDCYVCADATGVVNGNVNKAYVYRNSISNFNNDVGYLNHEYGYDDGSADFNASVLGKLSHLVVHKTGHTKYDLYDFTKPAHIKDGKLQNSSKDYSTTPSSAAPVTPAAPAAPSAPAADELDDVPKTGDSTIYLWAFGLAAVCFAGSYSLKKRF